MFFSGIGDEAGRDAAAQVRAQQELGWSHIELRNVGGKNAIDLPAGEFDHLVSLIEVAGLRVSCLASQIANWARPISGDIERDLDELRHAAVRARRLGNPFIRVMSYPNADPPWPEVRWASEAIRRLKILAKTAEELGLTLVHENCSGWGGLAPERTVRLLREVNSPALTLVFDTGNPCQYGGDSWAYYEAVKGHISYVHIKDYFPKAHPKDERACMPGEGDGNVRRIVGDLLARGYDGGFSIEPHITSVIHLHKDIQDPELAYRTYIEYGRRFEALVSELRGASARR